MRVVSLIALTLIAQLVGSHDLPVSHCPAASEAEVSATMRRAFDWQMSNLREGLSSKHGWTHAVFFAGVMAAHAETHDEDYLSAATKWAEGEGWLLGPRLRHADDHCAAQTYIDIWFLRKDPAILSSTRETFDAIVAAPAPGREEWGWCDALFMAAPALAGMSAATGDLKYLDVSDSMWWDATDALYDPDECLFYRDSRARAASAGAGPRGVTGESDGRGRFWGRGNGWVMAATASVLDHMPDDYPTRGRYEELLCDIAARVAPLQGEEGLWRSDLLDVANKRSAETSATGLFCYALAWGINEGLLDAEKYRPVVERAWRGLAAEVDHSGRLGRVQQRAIGPGVVRAKDTAEYAVGALLLAGSEVLRLAGSQLSDEPQQGHPTPDRGGPRPGRAYPAITSDGAWCWFAGPRAVCFEGEHRRTYIGWVSRTGDVCVASVCATTGEIKSSIVGRTGWPNDHATPSLVVRNDGRIMVFYCGHGGRNLRYRTSLGSEDISEWSEERSVETNTEGWGGYSYPSPVLLSGESEELLLFWRGASFKPCFSTSADGVSWSDARPLLNIEGIRRRPRPYIRVVSNRFDTIHIAFTNGHPDEEPFSNIYYACYKGGAFRRADGSVIGSLEDAELDLERCDLVYDARIDSTQSWVWDVAEDAAGRPIIAYATFPKEDQHQYWYASWNGDEWEVRHVTAAGAHFPKAPADSRRFEACYSGGLTLDRADPSVVYLSRPVNGTFEIERWTLSDDGTAWRSEPITAGSLKDNVRPCVPEGRADWGPEAIWMHGDYVDYANFSTGLRMR